MRSMLTALLQKGSLLNLDALPSVEYLFGMKEESQRSGTYTLTILV